MSRKKIEDCFTLDFQYFTIDEAIADLQRVKKELRNVEITNVHALAPHDQGWVDIEYIREENDREYETRLKREKEADDKAKYKKQLEYEKLRYEFEEDFEPTLVFEAGGKKYWLGGGGEVKKCKKLE